MNAKAMGVPLALIVVLAGVESARRVDRFLVEASSLRSGEASYSELSDVEAQSSLAALGKQLFFERSLSLDSTTSCATCHDPEYAFSERRTVSAGIGRHARRRNAPSLLNATQLRALDWDGQASDLESQLDAVFSEDGDMGLSFAEAVRRSSISSRITRYFADALNAPPTEKGMRRAFAAFQCSLSRRATRFDRFLIHGDHAALSAREVRGWELFNSSRAGCAGCHSPLRPTQTHQDGALFTDESYHNLGVGFVDGIMTDLGRYAVTGRPADWGAFRTPSLRNVRETAPYMHDGSLATLEDVILFYSRGGRPNPRIDVVMTQRNFSDNDVIDLVAFLRSLSPASGSLADSPTVADHGLSSAAQCGP